MMGVEYTPLPGNVGTAAAGPFIRGSGDMAGLKLDI